VETEIRGNGPVGSQTVKAPGRREQPVKAENSGLSNRERHPQRGELKKVVGPSPKRKAVKAVVEKTAVSVRRACNAIGLTRSSYQYQGKANPFQERLLERIEALCRRYPRYGYRRITILLQKEGWKVNKKRIRRLMGKLGLQVKRKAQKRARLGLSTGTRQRAEYPRQVWSWDIIQDQMADGRILKCLTLLDEYTRESLKIRVDYYMTSGDVIREVESAFQEYGEPEYIRSDNGSEFIAKIIQNWLKEKQIATLYIPPGSPWENPYIESFHGKFRDECLSRELFLSLIEARQIIEEWRKEYNQERPHSSLGYLTPEEFRARCCNSSVATLPASCNNPQDLEYTNI